MPKNFVSVNVTSEIKAIPDSDSLEGWDTGLCNLSSYCKVYDGDNHGGYIGFRNYINNQFILDDGAMNAVVDSWRNS